jgi:hypothetical protein
MSGLGREFLDQLTAALSRQRRTAPMLAFGALVTGVVAVVLVAAGGPRGGSAAAQRHAGTNSRSTAASSYRSGRVSNPQESRAKRRFFAAEPDVDPADTGVPSVSTATADAEVSFALLVPNTPGISRQELKGTYVMGDAAQMDFPPLGKPADDVRQPEITVWEAQWSDGDPLAAYKQDLANDPDPNKSICSVGDLPALCVEAKSPNDVTQENPAFVRVVIDKLEVESSGGASVQDLREVAGSLAPSGG